MFVQMIQLFLFCNILIFNAIYPINRARDVFSISADQSKDSYSKQARITDSLSLSIPVNITRNEARVNAALARMHEAKKTHKKSETSEELANQNLQHVQLIEMQQVMLASFNVDQWLSFIINKLGITVSNQVFELFDYYQFPSFIAFIKTNQHYDQIIEQMFAKLDTSSSLFDAHFVETICSHPNSGIVLNEIFNSNGIKFGKEIVIDGFQLKINPSKLSNGSPELGHYLKPKTKK